jgi:predicted RNA-binding protein with PUA-like domain
MADSFWLFKSEPETYSFDQLIQDKKTNWDHVRNYQARNFLRQVKKGDLAIIYHSGDDKAAVGIAQCVREAYPDIDPEGGDWVQIDLKPVEKFKTPVTLATMKATPALKDLSLIKQSRLSCMSITPAHFQILKKMGMKK